MDGLKNLRAFEIKYISPTNARGARVLIKDLRFNKKVFVNYSFVHNDCKGDALNFLKDKGIICLCSFETKNGYVLLSDNFENQIK